MGSYFSSQVNRSHADRPVSLLTDCRLKCVLIGPSGSGKTTFVNHLAQLPVSRQPPSESVRVTLSRFRVPDKHVSIFFDLWDVPGQAAFEGLSDGYYINADAAIAFLDGKSEASLHASEEYLKPRLRNFQTLNPDSVVVFVVRDCGSSRGVRLRSRVTTLQRRGGTVITMAGPRDVMKVLVYVANVSLGANITTLVAASDDSSSEGSPFESDGSSVVTYDGADSSGEDSDSDNTDLSPPAGAAGALATAGRRSGVRRGRR